MSLRSACLHCTRSNYGPRLSLALKINPIEIPELLHIVGCHLSIGDHKTCMLVSKTWLHLFRSYTWNHLIYSRQGVPYLDKYGHLVRTLTTYSSNDKDLQAIAGSCHFVRRLELSLNLSATFMGLEILVGNLSNVRELTLEVTYCAPKHLICISRLKRLQILNFSVNTHYSSDCNVRMLLNAIGECRSLVSLKITRLGDTILPSKHRDPFHPSRREAFAVATSPVDPASTTILARLGRTLRIAPAIPRPNRPSAHLSSQDPWRKFIRDSNIPIHQTASEVLLSRPLDISEPFSLLRRIHLDAVSTAPTDEYSQTGLEILFRKTPSLEDLIINCGTIRPKHMAACLDAITESCHWIQSLELVRLQSDHSNSSSIHRFFKQHRPNLKVLRLQACTGLEYVLDLIPSSTLALLERVSFELTLYSHQILHRFMTRCKSLQYFTWKVERRTVVPPGPAAREDPNISAFVEPWACYGTMRHIEQVHAIYDDESFEAYHQRLTQMERLVSLGISIPDLRKSMVAVFGDSNNICQSSLRPLFQDISKGEANPDGPFAYVAQRTIASEDSSHGHRQQSDTPAPLREHHEKDDDGEGDDGEGDEGQDRWRGWYFESVQELVLGLIGVDASTHLLDTRQLTLNEVRYILRAFPKLRKIRYRGRIYPLDHEARKYLEDLQVSRILVIHVSQGAPML
ncbi:hypothetical protein BGX23_006670 [Mortierella sp. AD031]|nr:hypothetical protein BGX23_006670 [Mortierella sp. AD031]